MSDRYAALLARLEAARRPSPPPLLPAEREGLVLAEQLGYRLDYSPARGWSWQRRSWGLAVWWARSYETAADALADVLAHCRGQPGKL